MIRDGYYVCRTEMFLLFFFILIPSWRISNDRRILKFRFANSLLILYWHVLNFSNLTNLSWKLLIVVGFWAFNTCVSKWEVTIFDTFAFCGGNFSTYKTSFMSRRLMIELIADLQFVFCSIRTKLVNIQVPKSFYSNF